LEILVRLKQTNDIQPFYAYSMEIPDHLILTPQVFAGALEEPDRGQSSIWRCMAQDE
jgi:hypothetical protein